MLRELRHRITRDVSGLLPHSLQGLSGVGKTQIAVEYAHRFGPDYDIVWWVPAEQRAAARESLAELATRLDLGAPEAGTAELIRSVLDVLRTGRPYRRWLLIYDNAGAPEELRSLLVDGPGDTLITSRDPGWESWADVIDVDVYTRAESTDFLRRRIHTLSGQDAERLAEELGDLPLALEHVAGWLSTTRMTADDYLGQLRKQAAELLATGRPANYPTSVAVTYTISMNRLREQNPDAAQLLDLCAFIGPHPVPFALLTDAPRDALPPGLGQALGSPAGRVGILQDIRSYSLARISDGEGGPFPGPRLQQHRLVQAVVRDTVSRDRQAGYAGFARRLLAAADPDEPEIPQAWPIYSALLPHVLSANAARDTDPAVRRLVRNEARSLWRRGEFATCLALVSEAIAAWGAVLDEAEPDLFLAYRERSNAMQGLGMFTDALQADQAVYDLAVRRCGPDHPDTLRASALLASDHRRLGNFASARDLDAYSLAAVIRHRGPDDPESLRLAHNMAVNHRLADEFPAALEIDRYNAEVAREVVGPDALFTIFAENNVARDLRECGQYFESLAAEEIIFGRYRDLFGPDNPDTLRAMKNLAVSRRKAGRYAEAAEMAAEVLDRHRRRLGELHPETLAATTNLGNDHRCLGQFSVGRGYAEQALRGYRRVFGDEHAFTACAAANLAALVRLTGDPVQARALNEETLARLRRAFGPDHRYTFSCAVNLASDLAALGEAEAARALDTDTLTGLRARSGEDHPYTLSCAINLALDLRDMGDRTGYRELANDTIMRYQRTLGAAHPEAEAAAAQERAVCDIEPPPI